jgi:hypothetical protein
MIKEQQVKANMDDQEDIERNDYGRACFGACDAEDQEKQEDVKRNVKTGEHEKSYVVIQSRHDGKKPPLAKAHRVHFVRK